MAKLILYTVSALKDKQSLSQAVKKPTNGSFFDKLGNPSVLCAWDCFLYG